MQEIGLEMKIYLKALLQSYTSKQIVQKYRFMHYIWENLDFNQN